MVPEVEEVAEGGAGWCWWRVEVGFEGVEDVFGVVADEG